MKKLIGHLQKIWIFLEENFLVALVILMGLDIMAQIISRSLFSKPFAFTEELARYLQIWITFGGIGYCYRKKHHISATFFYDKFPPAVKTSADIISNLFILFLVVLLIPKSMAFADHQGAKQWITTNFSLYCIVLSVPVGFSILAFYIIADTVRQSAALTSLIRNRKKV